MNILIIGGMGFIGQNLSKYFTNENVFIVTNSVLNDSSKKVFSVKQMGWPKIIEQLKSYKNWVVLDLAYASVPGTSFIDPIKDFTDNLYIINKNLEAVIQLDVEKYIYVSSGGTVYGNPIEKIIDEKTDNYPLSPYGITKMACERYVNMYRELRGLKTVVIRPSNVYGPLQAPFRGQGLISTALGLAYKNESVKIFGGGGVIRDYIFIDDFCKATKDIINFAKSGHIFNISSAQGISVSEIINMVNRVIEVDGYNLKCEHLPERPFDVKSNILDNTRLNSLNGWKPKINLNEGIYLTWQWIKDFMK